MESSVWILKETGLFAFPERHESFRIDRRRCAINCAPLSAVLVLRLQSLQIDRIFLSFQLSRIDQHESSNKLTTTHKNTESPGFLNTRRNYLHDIRAGTRAA
ncbi:hypothetical protein [Burkholderia latens]|uniref:hypothetical protein n=1 Tax=Burkholderia latens TaxID=488446 RepID=UPI00158DDF7F|nr:hypothetical protein [Burkholderia latens]